MNFIWQSKRFAQKLAQDWLAGCYGGLVIRPGKPFVHGPVALYGIQPDTFPLWLKLREEGRDWYYIDNAYLSPGHDGDSYVRITKNALQCSGYGTSNLKRLAAHEIQIKDWQDLTLGKILITCQSGWWYIQHGTTIQAWLDRVIAEIREQTDREIKVRLKPKSQYKLPPMYGDLTAPSDDDIPFEEDLKTAFCIVAHSSNTAVEAIMAGVPAFVLGQSAAQPFASNDLKFIEAPFMSYRDRWNWAGVLADNQWSRKEIREGKAWADLNA